MKHTTIAIIGAVLFSAGLATVALDPMSIGPVAGRGDINDFMKLQVFGGIPATVIGAALTAWAFISKPR